MTLIEEAPPGMAEEVDPTAPVVAPVATRRRGKPPRTQRPPTPPRMPQPPRRPPPSARVVVPLGPGMTVLRGILVLLSVILLAFAVNLMVLSQVQHLVSQQRLEDSFRVQLADGTAPVSEGDIDDVLLADGDPVATIDIPALGISEVVAEGTSSKVLAGGPGHRRDTVLPGQAGLSVIMGRAAAYGGPFSRIQELTPGEIFTVTTGQGVQTYEVIGVRYAGDAAPASPAAGQSRLILETARGPAFIPDGVARVDAQLRGDAKPAGIRQTTYATLDIEDKELATDTSTAWALVFALQFFVVIEFAAVWSFRRIGAQKTWIVFAPLTLVGGLLVADQITRLLPNLL